MTVSLTADLRILVIIIYDGMDYIPSFDTNLFDSSCDASELSMGKQPWAAASIRELHLTL
jgi:hypothetical protein